MFSLNLLQRIKITRCSLVGAAKPALDKRSQYSIGLLSPVLCCRRFARLNTFAVAVTLLSPVRALGYVCCHRYFAVAGKRVARYFSVANLQKKFKKKTCFRKTY